MKKQTRNKTKDSSRENREREKAEYKIVERGGGKKERVQGCLKEIKKVRGRRETRVNVHRGRKS